MRLFRPTLSLLLALQLAGPAHAGEERPEVDPRVGFELETRGPLGQVLVVFHQAWALPAAFGSALVFGLDSPVTDALLWSAALGVPNIFQGLGRLVILAFWQPVYFRTRGRPYLFDGLKIVDQRTNFAVELTADMFVTETRTTPATLADLRANEAFVDDTTFGTVSSLGGAAAVIMGSTHVHVDLEGFAGDAQLLRDFIADFVNTPALYRGPLTRDRFTSTDPRRIRAAIAEVIERFDAGQLRTVDALAYALWRAGLRKTGSYGTAVAVRRGLGTLELRFPRAVRGGFEMTLWAQLLRARLNWLRRNPGVTLAGPTSALSRADQYRQLRDYVTRTGLDWAPYEAMLPRRWRWFIGRRVEACDAILIGGTLQSEPASSPPRRLLIERGPLETDP